MNLTVSSVFFFCFFFFFVSLFLCFFVLCSFFFLGGEGGNRVWTASHRIQLLDTTRHALSSGEAELYATGRAAAGGLQAVQLLVEAGMEPKLEVLTDSSANLGMHNRIGSGRVQHLDVKWLWTQEALQSGRFSEEGQH